MGAAEQLRWLCKSKSTVITIQGVNTSITMLVHLGGQ